MPNRFINNLPITKLCAELDLSDEINNKCRVVYKISEGKTDIYEFDSLWNPDKNYSDEYAILPVGSVFDKIIQGNKGDMFSNVIGSSYDKLPAGYSSWIDILKKNNIKCDSCMTDGYFYTMRGNEERYFTDYHCGGKIVGGHVVGDINNPVLEEGDYVCIVPICNNHNVCCTDHTGRTGSGFYMRLKENTNVVLLKKYLQIEE